MKVIAVDAFTSQLANDKLKVQYHFVLFILSKFGLFACSKCVLSVLPLHTGAININIVLPDIISIERYIYHMPVRPVSSLETAHKACSASAASKRRRSVQELLVMADCEILCNEIRKERKNQERDGAEDILSY